MSAAADEQRVPPQPAVRATIVFYVSGHGFGHASRDIEVMNALFAREPGVRILVRTTAPRWLFERTVAGRRFDAAAEYSHVEADTGIVQIDSLHLDAEATVRATREFMRTFDDRVADEAEVLARESAALVVADIPALGVAAASRAGIPVVALGNFTWDWIYSGYPGADDLVKTIGEAYAQAALALRLPMHGGFATCRSIVDLPFIARRSHQDPAATRAALGFPPDLPLVLLSFGGYGLEGLSLDRVLALDGYRVVVSGGTPFATLADGSPEGSAGLFLPLDEHAMYDAGLRYEDVVRAVDVVVSKPGYGIIAECIANDTALLYTSRGHFLEYDVLVAEMPRYLRSRFISHDDLFSGQWQPHLDALLSQSPLPERAPTNGADVAADHFLGMIGFDVPASGHPRMIESTTPSPADRAHPPS